jgi:CDGSH iron-sulfur domain-containing protein 3
MSDVTITVRDNGNYRVEGPITILDGEGRPILVPEGKAVLLCRCGHSATKPFCDSSHRREGFESVIRAGDAATS